MSADTDRRFRVVADTNLIIAAGSSWVMPEPPVPDSSKPAQRLVHRIASAHVGLFCGKIAGEYIEKLIDLKHPTERVTRYIAYLLGAFELVKIVTQTCNPAPTDPDDIIFVLCAIDGRAQYLVTEDKHLLAIRGDYDPPKICGLEEALKALGG